MTEINLGMPAAPPPVLAPRRPTRQIKVGKVGVGSESPVSVQSMTTTLTSDVNATLQQIAELTATGCDIVRVACPSQDDADALAEIAQHSQIPVIADIHFQPKYVYAAIDAGCAAVRVNPGNIRKFDDQVKEIARAAKDRGTSIRIGVNAGSLDKRILEKYGKATPEALVESAVWEAGLFEEHDFHDFKISVKHNDPVVMVRAYELLAEAGDWPLHLGVTEAGPAFQGTIKSATAFGALLSKGIGDTIRVSLSAPPVEEVKVGIQILQSLNLRPRKLEIVSCPSCGRAQVDVYKLAEEVTAGLDGLEVPLRVAVMGCVVNGPGEAREADLGVASGNGKGQIFVQAARSSRPSRSRRSWRPSSRRPCASPRAWRPSTAPPPRSASPEPEWAQMCAPGGAESGADVRSHESAEWAQMCGRRAESAQMCGPRATICADWAGSWGTSAPTRRGGGVHLRPLGGQWSRGVTARARRLGRRVSDSSVSARVMARRPALMPSQRSGSGSQAGERWPTHGSRTSSVSRPSTRSRRVRPARFVVATPSPTYPPAQASPVPRSSPTEALPVAGDPERPAPGVGEAGAPQHREQVEQRRVQRGEHPVVVVELRPDPRAEVVRRPAAAEDQPVVGGPLAVDDQVPVVAERLTVPQPDLVPDRLRQRLGGDDQGVDRHRRARVARQRRRSSPRWRGRPRRRAPCRAACATRRGPIDVTRGVLVDPHAATFDGGGQPPHQPAGVQGGAVRCVRRAAGAGAVQHAGRLVGVEQPQLVLAAPPAPGVRDLGPGPVPLRLGCGPA